MESLGKDHSLLPWQPVHGRVLGSKHDQKSKFSIFFSDSSQIMLKLGRDLKWEEIF